MEYYEMIMQAIGTLGFPIVVACAMFWKINKQDEDHRKESENMTKALNELTITLQKVVDKLDNR